MGLPVEINPLSVSSTGGYQISRSLRFRSSASAYLNRTPASAGNRQTWTWSGWVKRGLLTTTSKGLFSAVSGLETLDIVFEGNTGATADTLRFVYYTGSALNGNLVSTPVYRDPSSWYHIVAVWNTTDATSSNRMRLYVNGVEVTAFGTASYPTQNTSALVNNTVSHTIGRYSSTTNYFDGYLAEVNFIDGQALTPSSFGETDAATGVWNPKKYSGTYGTNGFYLPFNPTVQATGFNVVTYTGNGGTQTIDGVGFQPDLIWIKNRGSAVNHQLHNSVVGWQYGLNSNNTNAEYTDANAITGATSSGWSMNNNYNSHNQSGVNYVAWCWKAGGAAVSNNSGTVTSQVSANTSTGFSVVSYTGTGSLATVGHGLGVAPNLIIWKNRSSAQNWVTYHSALGAAGNVYLNLTNGYSADSSTQNNTAPTSSVFTVATSTAVNGSTHGIVAYCFAEVAGYSKFGSYTGNGSASGPTVTTGFRPRWVMVKRTDTAGLDWVIMDTARGTGRLFADTSGAEDNSDNCIAYTSTGFQLTSNNTNQNASGGTYIYAAFADTTDAAFYFDASGNKNNWTPNNINGSASTQSSYDLTIDSPTPYADGGNGRGNYAVLNPLVKTDSASANTLSEGNLRVNCTSNSYGDTSFATIPVSSGKWYAEFTLSNSSYPSIEIFNMNYPPNFGSSGNGRASLSPYGYGYLYNGTKQNNGSASAYGSSLAVGDVVGIALDMDNGKVWFSKNGTWQASGDPAAGTNAAFTGLSGNFAIGFCDSQTVSYSRANFGQRPFSYTPPSGYKALNTQNLPAAPISNGANHFAATTYTGNGSTQSISNAVNGVSFQPDLVWVKNRSYGAGNVLSDSVRGSSSGKYYILESDATSPESDFTSTWYGNYGYLSAINSNGFTGVNGSLRGNYNTNSDAYIAWQWKGGGTAVTNNSGTITSQVSANTSAGFSIVTFSVPASGSSGTIGHGLGVTPDMIIAKGRGLVDNWVVWHKNATTTVDQYLRLNTTDSTQSTAGAWGSAVPNSTVFGCKGGTLLAASQNAVAYCFSAVRGFSAFGSYTGNGSSDGPMIYTGFRPRFVMLKTTGGTADHWVIRDTSRDTYNASTTSLYANLSIADDTPANGQIDILSNGFKIRGTANQTNQSGIVYIYAAFAESPFNLSRAR